MNTPNTCPVLSVRLPGQLAEALRALVDAEQKRSVLPVTASTVVRRALLRELGLNDDGTTTPAAN